MSESTDKQLLDEAMADEQQLDEYLKGDSSVSRQYRQLQNAEVPAELDRLVLRQAEDAVKDRSTRARPAWVRWSAPLAVAASAVVALSIVMQTGLRDETVTAVSARQVPQATMQADREDDESKQAEEAGFSEKAAPLSAPGELQSPTFAPAVPPPPPVQADGPASAVNAASRPVPRPVTQSRRAAPPPAPARPATSGQSIARSAEIASRELQAMAMESQFQEEHDAQEQSDAAADNVASDRREEGRTTLVTTGSRRINVETPAAPQYSDPEDWLKDIRELRKANKQEEADREWQRFRAAFPNHAVADTDAARPPEKQPR